MYIGSHYKAVRDSPITIEIAEFPKYPSSESLEFRTPNGLMPTQPAIIAFVTDLKGSGKLRLRVKLNGENLWTYLIGAEGAGVLWEVFKPADVNMAAGGNNTLAFEVTGGFDGRVAISDVVLWYTGEVLEFRPPSL